MFRVWNCVETQHDLWLVLLAGLTCALTCLAAISLFQRARATEGRARIVWLVAAGTVTGSGVWVTHFIAILAYSPGFAIEYDLALTLLSLVATLVMVTTGFTIALFGTPRWSGLAGGVMVGLSIGIMHFTGMAALRLAAEIVLEPATVIVSVILAVVFGAAALHCAMHSRRRRDLGYAAGLLALATLSHHFVAMAAVGLIPHAVTDHGVGDLSPMALAVAVATVIALVIAGMIGIDFERRRQREIGDRNIQLDAALNNMGQGLCMFDPNGRLQVWNDLFLKIYRLPPNAISAGCNGAHLLDARAKAGTILRDLDYHRQQLRAAMSERRAITAITELVDGRIVNVSFRPMANGGWVATHDDLTERMRAEARIAHLARHDLLTDLANRTAFQDELKRHVSESATSGAEFAVLSINLDRFKAINEVYGQTTGDNLLRQVAQRLQARCDGAFLARPGADEFMLISTGPQPDTAEDLSTRLMTAFDTGFTIDGLTLRIGGTIGVAISPRDGSDAEALLANVGTVLDRAKAEARGSVRFFEPAMDQKIRDKHALQRDLTLALARNEFELNFQPQAAINGDIVAFEVLARWRHPQYRMIAPSVFIPLAEETGHITALDEWILREACREAASWTNPISIAVNLSPIDFLRDDLPGMIHSILFETGLSAARLEIEITEGVLIQDAARATNILRQIKTLGVRLAMDDFGTGYSSLSYLQLFPFDKIKIDRAFIAKLDRTPQSAAIVRAIIGLGRGLDLPVLAEGVETRAQLDFLAAEGCSEIQGYLIGRPQPIAFYHHIVESDARFSETIPIAS
jgi:diguanylate cyclase (GGDEF)-like protein